MGSALTVVVRVGVSIMIRFIVRVPCAVRSSTDEEIFIVDQDLWVSESGVLPIGRIVTNLRVQASPRLYPPGVFLLFRPARVFCQRENWPSMNFVGAHIVFDASTQCVDSCVRLLAYVRHRDAFCVIFYVLLRQQSYPSGANESAYLQGPACAIYRHPTVYLNGDAFRRHLVLVV